MVRLLLPSLLTLFCAVTALAQGDPSWRKPFPAHKVAGNLYYVGTEDLACFLLATPQGHILINTGLADSAPLIRESMKRLGFRLEDVKILLTNQAHFDHVAAMAEIQKISGAQVFATEADAPVLEDGGKSDPFLGAQYRFAPVTVTRRLKQGDTVSLGGTELKVVLTPGHSIGSVTYTTTVMDGERRRSAAIANMGTVVMPLTGNRKYPTIAEDFKLTFANQKRLSPEIWVAAHASQYGMAEKLKRGSFVDPQGYKAAIQEYELLFLKELAKQKKAR